MTRAVIYVVGPVRPSPHEVARQKKIETCRAYCRRMGYDVVALITASKPKPDVSDEAMRIFEQHGREAMRAFLEAQPHHPGDDAEAMLERGEADVQVEFTSIGDSGPFEWDFPPEIQEKVKLPRIERASLWEIDPPTPERRQCYQWFEEDWARRRKGEPTHAVIYVRAAASWSGREAAKQQEEYCRGYCRQQDYKVVDVFHDTVLVGDTAWPGLQHAVRAVDEGQAHLLVALDKQTLATDAAAIAAMLVQVPRIEYADAYAKGIQLQGFIQAMERLVAMLDQKHSPSAASEDAGEHPPEPTKRPGPHYRIHSTTDIGIGSHKHVVKASISQPGDPVSPVKRNVSIDRLIKLQEDEGATFEVVAGAPGAHALPRGRFVQCSCGGYSLVEARWDDAPSAQFKAKRRS